MSGFGPRIAVLAQVALLLSLVSCASVDQFGPRINDANQNSQSALNNEILLNIIRASHSQSLNFIAISQVSGAQQETHNLGLPTFGIGPHQTAAEHVYTISNSVSSQFTGGYQSNPLISTAFQTGMLQPVSLRTVALLESAHSREIVLTALIDSITIKSTKSGSTVARFRNDPENNYDFNRESDGSLVVKSADCSFYDHDFHDGQRCSYSKFLVLLQFLLADGLTAELAPGSSEAASGTPASASGAASSPVPSSGSLCLDPAYPAAGTRLDSSDIHICNATQKAKKNTEQATAFKNTRTTKKSSETTEQSEISGTISAPKNPGKIDRFNIFGFGPAEISFQFRSPQQYFNYLGTWLRNPKLKAPRYNSIEARGIIQDEPYLFVDQRLEEGCYASVLYAGAAYCVPQSSRHTAILMDIAEALRNLNITPADLNSAFTVHVAPG